MNKNGNSEICSLSTLRFINAYFHLIDYITLLLALKDLTAAEDDVMVDDGGSNPPELFTKHTRGSPINNTYNF